jgi:hypothetical protein
LRKENQKVRGVKNGIGKSIRRGEAAGVLESEPPEGSLLEVKCRRKLNRREILRLRLPAFVAKDATDGRKNRQASLDFITTSAP